MSGFNVLFKLGLKKRFKDSFLISYGIIFPLFLIGVLGYMTTNYFSGDNGITSFYYYTMVIIPFCTFQGAVTMAYVAKEESEAKCGERFIIAPISKTSIVLSKIIPSTIVMMFYNLLIMVICRVFFKVNYGGKFIELLLIFSLLCLLTCSLGTFIGLCSKSFMEVKNFISTPILIFAALGGAFFPIASLGEIIEKVSYLSPLTWINKGIFLMINDNNNVIYILAVFITIILAIIFTLLSVRYFKKEALL